MCNQKITTSCHGELRYNEHEIIYCMKLKTGKQHFLFRSPNFSVIDTSAVSTLPTNVKDAPASPSSSSAPSVKNSSSPVKAIADALADSNIDPDELQKRTEFLKEQRDKLLAMKKAEREKQLAEVEQQQLRSRPKSARAARSAMKHRSSKESDLDPETLKARRALAEKLKQEVICAHIE